MFKKMFANCLLVSDFEKSLDFYKNKLRLGVTIEDKGFASFKLENIELAILDRKNTIELGVSEYLNNGGAMFLCFQTVDINSTYKTLVNNGVKFITPPMTTSWGQNVAYFVDPDKNIWEISTI